MSEPAIKPATIVISSHVARGSIGSRAAVFALETLGFPVWTIPTILLPWHPGHGPATRIVPKAAEFDAFIEDIANAPWTNEIGGILTGYMANPEQVTAVAGLVSSLKEKKPDLRFACDPVIGDGGGLYVAEETAIAIREKLLPLSDILTPNRYELAWICDDDVPITLNDTKDLAGRLGLRSVLVTSVPGDPGNRISNLLLEDDKALLSTHEKLENPPNGTGDLFAALFLGNQLSGIDSINNLQKSTAAVLEILQNTAETGSNELLLAGSVDSLSNPRMNIEVLEL
ncbi:MAG: pyridoxal kinase [Rhizobiaceae bacterium]